MLRPARWLILCLLFAPISAIAADFVKNITVEGSQRIESSAVISYFGLKPGESYTAYDLDVGLKKIYETGFYSDVSLNNDAGSITITVKENPSINQVIFEGNERIDKEDLEKEITLKSRSVYTKAKVQSDLKRLLDVYRRNGRYSAEITPQIIPLEQNRVNLVYSITEGPKALIEKITFIGNDSYESSTLSKVISSERQRWYKFLTDNDKYDPDRLNYDQELLRRFYFQNGYADFKVKSAIAELSPQSDAFYLTFTIEEGEVYLIGKVDISTKLPKEKMPDLEQYIRIHPGDIYNASDIEDSINQMSDALGDAGFAFVEVTPDAKRRPNKEKIIDLTFTIAEGPKVYIERINIFGNLRTLDPVIRREFKLAEGDPFSTSKLKRSEQRLNDLGFFEKVDVQRKPGNAPDQAQLDVEVHEKSTGEISLGAGFSTTDGPLVDAGIRERNFLGMGQDVRARVTYGGLRQNFDLGFTEPYFLGREIEAGGNIYKTLQSVQSSSSFDRETLGTMWRLGYKLSEHLTHQLRYTLEQTDITNTNASTSRFVLEQVGKNTASIIGHAFIYDERDSKQAPTSGYSLRFNQDFAGIGGDNTFIRHEFHGNYYIPIAKKWTYLIEGSAGNIHGIGEAVRINQRFFIGAQEIRGFSNAGIGARDLATEDPLGGNSYYAVTNELRFPLGLSDDLGVTGATFLDMADLFGIDQTGTGIADGQGMRMSVGVGVGWASPFGPIRIDAGLPLMKQNYDDTQLIRFRFGTNF